MTRIGSVRFKVEVRVRKRTTSSTRYETNASILSLVAPGVHSLHWLPDVPWLQTSTGYVVHGFPLNSSSIFGNLVQLLARFTDQFDPNHRAAACQIPLKSCVFRTITKQIYIRKQTHAHARQDAISALVYTTYDARKVRM